METTRLTSAERLRTAAVLMRERAEGVDARDFERRIVPKIGRRTQHGQHIASWHPAVALAVADLLDAEAEKFGYFHLARANCRESDTTGDCGCAYKDCYEHGKWHNCTHGEPDLTSALTVASAYLGDA